MLFISADRDGGKVSSAIVDWAGPSQRVRNSLNRHWFLCERLRMGMR